MGHGRTARGNPCASSDPTCRWRSGLKEEGIADEAIRERLRDAADRKMAEKAANLGPEMMRLAEKNLLLQTARPELEGTSSAMDHLRQGIGLRACLCPARPAERVQARSLLDVRDPARPAARADHADPRPYRNSRDEPAPDAGAAEPAGSGGGEQSIRRRRSENPATWSKTQPQRRLPLRLGQEVQALPWAAGEGVVNPQPSSDPSPQPSPQGRGALHRCSR